ncbi:MAG: glycosyltransferase [Streptosporangiales bacterium]
MRIAIVTEVWRPSVNGVVTRLMATVSELVRAGHQVLLITPTDADGDFPGVLVRKVPTIGVPFVYGGQRWGLPVRRVRRWLADFAPDVVHVVNPVLLGLSGVRAAYRLGVPLVCSYHTDVTRYADSYHLGFLRPVIRRVLRRLYSRAALILVTSRTGQAQLDWYDIVPAAGGSDKTVFWPRGVDLDRFQPSPNRPDRDGAIRALYVGRLADEKNLADLAPLAAAPKLRLVVVGDGPGRQALAARLAGGRVRFTGTLHGADLAEAYASADALVFPSTTETLGLVLLEALASGLPVVAADSPASREMLAGCPASRLYPAGRADQIEELVEDLLAAAPREVLAEQARAHVAGDGWVAVTERLVDYYQRARQLTTEAASLPRTARRDRLHRQAAAFGVVGGLNALIDLGVFNLLLAIGPTRAPGQIVVYNTVAVLAAIANSYWWNSRWTFRHRTKGMPRRARIRQKVLFAAQAGLNIAVNDGVVAALAILFTTYQVLAPPVANNITKVAAMLAASAVSFLAMRLVVFRRPRPEPDTYHQRPDRSGTNRSPDNR